MDKINIKKNTVFIFSSIFFVVGLIVIGLGFFMADNKVENFKSKGKDPWYQTVHVNEKNQFRISIQIGPVSITQIG